MEVQEIKSTKKSKVLKITFAIVLLVALISVGIFIYVSNNKPLEGSNMVDIGGYKLAINVEGKGKETIVFNSEFNTGSDCWGKIIPELSKTYRTVTYDRAGVGKSEQSPHPRTAEEKAKELHQLLKNAHIKGPYILVGNSIGGFDVRLFANKYPAEVTGIILVDAAPENYVLNSKSIFSPSELQIIEESTKEFEEITKKQSLKDGSFEEILKSAQQAKDTQESIKNIPLIAMIGIGDLAVENYKEIRKKSVNCQKEVASLFLNSKVILVKNSLNYIQNDKPELVIDAIKQMSKMINSKSK